ncbi:MAG: cupin domain-containing protein [Rhodospirillales bacterium]|nr:cupin domain-containing protein [Rhodospirillales bacterium]
MSDQKPDQFHQDMEGASVRALWEAPGPQFGAADPAHVWKWDQMDPMLDAAIDATDMRDAERRVLCMVDPNTFKSGGRTASVNLSVNFQVLLPGEMARPHRHSPNALRFVVEGDGKAITKVDGKECPMLPGDMILTPAWTWHEHIHGGEGRAVWLDALDVPILSHFNIAVFEPGPTNDFPDLLSDGAHAGAGLTPMGSGGAPATTPNSYSPMFRYPWATVIETLDQMAPAADGSKRLRYTHTETGGAAMGTVDCYLLSLAKGQETQPYRTNANMVCYVAEGEGASNVGEQTISWGKSDVFTLPHGNWISHKAASKCARIFQITDREVLSRLDYLTEEFKA